MDSQKLGLGVFGVILAIVTLTAAMILNAVEPDPLLTLLLLVVGLESSFIAFESFHAWSESLNGSLIWRGIKGEQR